MSDLLEAELKLNLPGKPVRSISFGPNNMNDPMIVINELLPRIQTELNAVLGQTQIMSTGPTDQDSGLEMIRTCTERTLGLIQQSRLLMQIESGQYRLKNASSPLDILLDLLEAITRPLAEAKGLTYRLCRDADLPACVYTCGRTLRYCLLQLIDNAIQFTEKGDIEIHVSVQQDKSKKNLFFTVTDSGPGIPDKDHDTVYQPFYQATPQAHTGSGLGLTVSQQLARKLGGRLSIERSSNKGTVVHLEIPIVQDAFNPPSADRPENSLQLINEISRVNENYGGPQRA